MAQVKVTAELLRGLAQTLRTESERFENIKSQMDEQLFSFMWEDPVAIKFKTDYEERLQSLKTKLLPAMDKYQVYLDEESNVIDSYIENGSSSLSAFKAAAVGAGVVGVGATGAAIGANLVGGSANNVITDAALVNDSYTPNPNQALVNGFKRNFKESFKDIRFRNKYSLTEDDLERTFNKMTGTNTKIEIRDEKMYLKDDNGRYVLDEKGKRISIRDGYYKSETNTVYLNRDEYEKWTDGKKINIVAHEYYHVHDSKQENQRESGRLTELQSRRRKLDNQQYFYNEYYLDKSKKEIAAIDKEIREIRKNNNYSGIDDKCYGRNGLNRERNVNGESCAIQEKKYLGVHPYEKYDEEHHARVHGESAQKAFEEFLVERKQERLQGKIKKK
jgi:hypothetical protein